MNKNVYSVHAASSQASQKRPYRRRKLQNTA